MDSKPVRVLTFAALTAVLAVVSGCLDEVPDSIRGVLPFMPPPKFVDRGGRKLTRAEIAYYQRLTDLSKATKVNPRDAVAFNGIGELLMKKGAFELARTCFQDAVKFDATLSEPHHNLGRLYLLEDRFHQAMEELEKARELSGDDAKIRTRLGIAKGGLGRDGEALAEFDEAIALDNEYTQAYLEKGRFLYARRNYAEAAQVCRTALEHIPPYVPPPAAKQQQTNIGLLDNILPGQTITEDDTPPPTFHQEAAFNLALCLKAQGQYGEALSVLLQAEGAGDGKADVAILRAKLQDLQGDSGGAIATLQALRTAQPELAEVPKLIARLYDKSGQSDLAVKTRLEAAELDQADRELQEEAARDAEARHSRARMIAVYERLVRIDPDMLRYRIQLAQAYDDIGIKREAALAWQEVINLRDRLIETAKRDGLNPQAQQDVYMPPNDYEVRRRAGMLYADMPGFQGKALIQFKLCLQRVPNDPEVHRKLGELYLLGKNYPEAEKHVRETLKTSPNDAKAHNNLANLFAGQTRYDDAVTEYKLALQLDPTLELAQRNLAKVLLGQNRREEALPPLRAYCQAKPLDVESRRMLADLLRDLNQKDAAVAELEAITALESVNGGDMDLVIELQKIQWELGQKDLVISDLEAQIEKHPSDLRLLLVAGRRYSETKTHVKAIYTWERVRGIATRETDQPIRIEALKKLSAEYDAIGKLELAISTSEEGGKLGDAECWRRCAELLLQKKNDPVKAAACYREVLKINLQDLDARRQLAALLQTSEKIQDREDAMKLYQEILTLNPKDEPARVNLGNLLGDFNRFSEALEEYETVLRQNPKNTSALVGHGVTLRKRSRYKEALDEYLKAIEIDPKLKIAYYNAAIIYEAYLPDAAKAKQYFDKYVELGGDPAKLIEKAPADPQAKLPVKGAAPVAAQRPRNARAEMVDTGLTPQPVIPDKKSKAIADQPSQSGQQGQGQVGQTGLPPDGSELILNGVRMRMVNGVPVPVTAGEREKLSAPINTARSELISEVKAPPARTAATQNSAPVPPPQSDLNKLPPDGTELILDGVRVRMINGVPVPVQNGREREETAQSARNL